MPLGFERLNERQQRPNALINFIKPLEGPDKATSQEFLSRIAAQCYPVMKKHYISVMALEEYEPNPEFLGRNFNAGEVIQLVLKDKQGRWLSLKFVQMVMMHELAHCKQMNHSRFFWAVRNDYAKQMEDLWRDGYVGEGMWGRGRGLDNGALVSVGPPDGSQIPQHLCGGSYRRRGKKRKRRNNTQDQPDKLTYAERQQRRIARKFGKHGDGASLGDDELVRGALETMSGSKRGLGKPRVANSKRGRELRAAAALARFEQTKSATPEQASGLDEDMYSETDSDWEKDTASSISRRSVVISDGRGHDLVKVCGDGAEDEEDAGKEMDELRMLSAAPNTGSKYHPHQKQPSPGQLECNDSKTDLEISEEGDITPTKGMAVIGEVPSSQAAINTRVRKDDPVTASDSDREPNCSDEGSSFRPKEVSTRPSAAEAKLLRDVNVSNAASQPDEPVDDSHETGKAGTPALLAKASTHLLACPICSLENEPNSPTCIACAHVLHPKLMPSHWRCTSHACEGSKYVNAGDVGRCGVCGAQKPKLGSLAGPTRLSERANGITGPELLRWE